MSAKFKIGDTVRYFKFPFESDEFLIVGDKNTPWQKATPYDSNSNTVEVESDKDFILLRKQGDRYGLFGISENGLHVKADEIGLLNN